MNRHIPLLLSISLHLIIIIFILILFPTAEVEPEDEKISVEILFKKEEKSIEKREFIDKSVDIIDNEQVVETVIEQPKRDRYIEQVTFNEPDLVILNKIETDSTSEVISTFDQVDFESSLENLMPVIEFEEDIPEEESLDISWDGEQREMLHNSYIDFSSFPKESFTGVGVVAEFMVNKHGEVYNVNIVAPGSGSIDFDILIKQYVSKFSFNPGDNTSIGEIFIVYKK